MFTALRSVGLLGRARLAKRRIHTRLRRLATKPYEKCGLVPCSHQKKSQVPGIRFLCQVVAATKARGGGSVQRVPRCHWCPILSPAAKEFRFYATPRCRAHILSGQRNLLLVESS